MVESVEDLVKLHEGTGPIVRRRFRVYDDATGSMLTQHAVIQGHPSIGYGRNLVGRGLSKAEADLLLHNDLYDVRASCEQYPWFADLNEPRQAAVMDLMFNIGPTRFKTFQLMIAALAKHDYETAAVEMLDSRWARQVGIRAERDYLIMIRGEWPLV